MSLETRLVALVNAVGADIKALIGRVNSKSLSLPDPTSSERVPLFYTTKPLTLTKLRASLPGATASPSVTYSVRFAADVSAAGTEAVTGGSVVTSTTAGNEVAAFTVATIPAGSWVWFTTTAKAGTVPLLHLTLEF